MLSSRPSHSTAVHRSSIPIRAVSSPVPNLSKCRPTTASRSAWTARSPGETTSSSSASGEQSSTRKSICMPTKVSARHDNRSVDTSPSTTQGDLTQPLTDAPPIRPTSTRCRSARQLKPRPTIHLATRIFCSTNRGHLTNHHHVGAGCDEVETKQVLDLQAIDLFGPAPLEVIEGFADGKAGVANSSFDAAHLTRGELTLNELREIIEVRALLLGGFAGQGLVVALDILQVQALQLDIQLRLITRCHDRSPCSR